MNTTKRDKLIRKVKRFIIAFFRYSLLIGLSYFILSPLLKKIATSFMTEEDLIDKLVVYIPRQFTVRNYQLVAEYLHYWEALGNTLWISLACGIIQTLVCTLVGYGLAKFRFKGRNLVLGVVLFSIITPPMTYQTSLYLKFRYFDVFGIAEKLTGSSINLLDSFWPLAILSITGCAFKNGIFIYMMRQFFRGFPDELEEAAYVDGSGVFRTFFRIIIPNSVPMMTTVFMLVFAWQWTDTFYTKMFFSRIRTLSNMLAKGAAGIFVEGHVGALQQGQVLTIALGGTYSLMLILPLIIIYLFAQKTLTEGIERSGIVG